MQKISPSTSADHLPHLAYDSVIFGFSGTQLKILIMEYHNTSIFALPGGFVQKKEHLNDAVRRGLKERTGLDNIHLEQFYTFGDADRNNAEPMRTILVNNGLSPEKYHWMLERFISVAYYALINYKDVVPATRCLIRFLRLVFRQRLAPADDGSRTDCRKSLTDLARQPGSEISEGQHVTYLSLR